MGWTDTTRYLPSRFKVSQFSITRQPLVELEGSGTRGFTLKFTSHTPIQYAAGSRLVNEPEASLRDWLLFQEACYGSLECSFAVGPKHATGLLGHLVVTLVDDVDLLICLGLDHNFSTSRHSYAVLQANIQRTTQRLGYTKSL